MGVLMERNIKRRQGCVGQGQEAIDRGLKKRRAKKISGSHGRGIGHHRLKKKKENDPDPKTDQGNENRGHGTDLVTRGPGQKRNRDV